jgi:hypothetical protein
MLQRFLGIGLLGGGAGGLWWLLCRLCPGRERIHITAPTAGATVTSPLAISGHGRAVQHNTLGVRVRDQAGAEIGAGSVLVSAPLGSPGPFGGSVAYSLVGGNQPGRVEVFDTSPRDGGLVHLSSVEVTLS